MQLSDDRLQYALDPLKIVDVKSLAAIADTLKDSKDKKKKAVGVFLDRINRYRTGELTPKSGGGAGSPLHPASGLKDLQE